MVRLIQLAVFTSAWHWCITRYCLVLLRRRCDTLCTSGWGGTVLHLNRTSWIFAMDIHFVLYGGPKLRVRPRMERPPASRMLALENFRITTPWSAIFEPGRSALQSIAISVSVCLSACLSVSLYQKPHVQISWNFLRLLPWLSPPMNRLHCCFRVTVESSGTITRSKLVTARQPKRRRLLVRVHCLRDSLAMWTMGRHSTDAERFTTPVQ